MKRLSYRLLCGLSLTTVGSCSKDDAMPTGPKEHQVEYRISSTTAPASDYISYGNESGGTITLNNVPLPVIYRFTRPMKQGNRLSLLASLHGGAAAPETTAAILLAGREVKKETGRGAKAQAVPVHVLGQ